MGSLNPEQNKEQDIAAYELPPEAGDIDAPRFEPEDGWLRGAGPELQQRAMRRWFEARYVNPVYTTPHDENGDYLFTGEGPCHPREVLDERFGGMVRDEVIEELAQALRREVGDDWAPRSSDPGVTS